MAKSCLFSPLDKNKKPYKALSEYKRALSPTTGTKAFLKALSPSFQERHKGKLDIDEQGVATLETAMKTPDMKNLIGFQAIKQKLEREHNFIEVRDTADNFRMLINDAKNFNDSNSDYIAYPEKTSNGIKNVVHHKNKDTVDAFNNMYGSLLLNDRLLNIFKPLGLNIEDLTEAEHGYSGIIDFGNAKKIAGEFVDLIRVSNNMSGQLALSEELSHLVIRMLRDKPLMQRLITSIADNEGAMQAILGDDYNQYIEQFTADEGSIDYDIIAEEAVGRLLQGRLLENTLKDENVSYLSGLWNRLVAFIKRTFKDYNANEINQAIIDADQTLDKVAKDLLSGTLEFSSENIENTIQSIEKEMQSIKEKAIADGTFMKAPNGKPTNLTEKQWLQVRTKAFKDWFGDWERVHYNNVSVDIAAPRDADGIPTEQRIYLDGKVVGYLPHYKGKIVTPSDTTVILKPEYRNKGIAKKAYIAIANYYKSQGITFKSDDYLSKDAIRLWESLVRDGYARKTFENLKDNDEFQSDNENHYRISYEFINDNIPNILDSSVSKVVDENGEPLVVYHGTNIENISIFDRTRIPEEQTLVGTGTATFGNFFSDKQNDAKGFADITRLRRNSGKATVYNTFLNIKNPMYFETLGDFRDYSHKEGHYNENGDFVSDVKLPKEYDGVIVKRRNSRDDAKEFVAPNPNQIKSATNNIGTFSGRNNSILYHLEKNVDSLQKIIEDAIATETKKKIIIKQDKAQERAQKKIDNLNAILNQSPEGRLKGLINYAHAAVNDLVAAYEALEKADASEANFSMLRGVRSTIQSYSAFIDQLGALINSNDEELVSMINDTSVEDKNHTTVTLRSAFNELSSLERNVKSKFKDKAFAAIENFFKPFFNVEGKFTDSTGAERSLRELIEEANGDIGFMDRYLMTMSTSGDLMLQLFDEVVKKAKADARYDTIEDLKEITRLMLDAEEKGITDFEWMYEKDSKGHKTGNYISAINTGQYEKDREEFFKQLEEEYGLNPTGERAKEKRTRRKEWLKEHGKSFGLRPNAEMYHNPEFDRLSTAQKDVLDAFMQLKQKFDRRLPANKTSLTKAIQMRRTSQQRFLNSLSNPEQAYQNIKESIAKEFTKSSDDDSMYGEKTGLRSFDGSEFKVLPAVYTRRLSNPEELTTDVFSALAAYSYSTNTYQQMDKVVDPLEVAKSWINDYRKVNTVSNGKNLVEKIKGKNEIVNAIFESTGTNIEKKLEDFMDSQVYGRYYADSDKTINVMGREIKAGKAVNKWLSISSMVQLGFNALAHLGNVATGVSMQNIEAFCGHYFNAKELLLADKEYANALMTFLPEVESKNPTNKLALFDQLFDVKQEFAGNTKDRMNTIFEKLFGKSLAFLGQTCGDHWLYNRTAIAMCLRKKVITEDGETTLWDALKVTNAFTGDNRIKELSINARDAETGEVIDREYIRKYSEKINEINHRLFGVYNTDDMVAAQRVALGRCVLQYRQWIVPMFARRFQNRRYVAALGEYEEGYYRTMLHLLSGLKNGLNGIPQVWDELDEGQKRNVYRALIEFSQFMAVWAIANFVDFGKDDPDRTWAMKLAEYMSQRELHELGNLTPSFTMGNEILKTVKSPATVLNTTQAALNLTASLIDFRDWNDEIESGKYEGMSTLHKNFLKAPFPILAPFNQLERASEGIEEVTRFYARPQ